MNETIFSKKHFNEICNILNDKQHILKQNMEYQKLEIKLSNLYDILSKKLSKEDSEKLEKFISIESEMDIYTYQLFYALGVKYGSELKNI